MQSVQNLKTYYERMRGMMERILSVTEAREQLSDLVDKVQHQGDAFIISRHGKPAAAVVPIEVYEAWKRQRNEFFDMVRKMQTQANLDPQDADKITTEAVEHARKQNRSSS